MTHVSTSIVIDRPSTEVFDFIADMANNPRWQKGQQSCEWTSAPPLGVGSTYDQRAQFLGKTIESKFEVTEFEPGRSIRIVSTSGPMEIDVTRTLTPLGANQCEVSATVRGEAPAPMSLLGGRLDPLVKKSVAGDYERLKALLEADRNLPPNHHGDYPQFNAIRGYVGALTMIRGRQPNAQLVAGLTPNLGPGTHILDIGCGPGNAVRTAARTGATATGLDPSGPMLNVAKLLTRVRPPKGEVSWIEAPAESIPLPDGSVDAVWSLKAVHHWPHLEQGLAEVARVLRPGGHFIVLETQSEHGATGVASHGWTPEQAELFAKMLRNDFGFPQAEANERAPGGSKVLVVKGQRGANRPA